MNKIIFICWVFFVSVSFLESAPPEKIPDAMVSDFTLNGTVPVLSFYWDNSPGKEAYFYSRDVVDGFIDKVNRKESCYYGVTDLWLYKLIERNIDLIYNKTVAIIGSYEPWYEAVIIAYGGHPYTIEYNEITTDDYRLFLTTVDEFEKKPKTFDTILSISSFEHDGLGRYGDPIDPYGDFKAMEKCKKMLNSSGKLILAVPVGRDCLAWNAHRIYGPIRLSKLLEGWKVFDQEGMSRKLMKKTLGDYEQPVFILEVE